MTNNDRATAALLRLQAALLRSNPDLNDGALARLLAVGQEALAYRGYVHGREAVLDLESLVDTVKGSEIASYIYRRDDIPTDADDLADLDRLPPAARIAAARARGKA